MSSHHSQALCIANDRVWLDGEALAQLERARQLEGCQIAVGMPDLHAGPGGLPIGVALGFADRIRPALLGSDVGCGARLVVTSARPPSLDRLERRARASFAEPMDCGPRSTLWEALKRHGVAGLARLRDLPQGLARRAGLESPEQCGALDVDPDLCGLELAHGLGTIGGGNHFGEVVVVDDLLDAEHGAQLHLRKGQLAVLVHSGSRGLGARLADRFASASVPEADAGPFLAAQAWACRFARANRLLLSHRLLALAGADRLDKHVLTVDSIHNEVVRLDTARGPLWVHRKGAAPAGAGELTLLLGSRGAPSFLMLGLGNALSLCTMAHGAGRRYSRADALAKMRAKHTRASLSRTSLGGRVLCERTELLYEEHPDVYKPVGPIVDCLDSAGVARPIARLRPLLTVKV